MSASPDLRQVAEGCARLGGAILQDARLEGPADIRQKGHNDFVTEVDAASERAIHAYIRERHPEHGFLGEESSSGALGGFHDPAGAPDASVAKPRRLVDAPVADSRHAPSVPSAPSGAPAGDMDVPWVQWVVDPLDGTTNFIHGFPAYAVSVAARGTAGILAAAIYDPNRDELFSAGRGAGATLNGEPMRVTSDIAPGQALVGTGFPFRHGELSDLYLESFRSVLAATSDVRRAGSATLDLAYVACGRLDGFWELGLSPWDIAAGWLLIEEAGGIVTDDEGGQHLLERGNVVAGGPEIHSRLLDIVRSTFSSKIDAIDRTRS